MIIVDKKTLVDCRDAGIVRLDISAPEIAKKAMPGQFAVLMVSEAGERIPLTVVDKDESKGIITLIFQEVGLTTRLLARLNVGDSLYALAGPLGHPTAVKNYGRVIIVGGGVGLAEILPVARAFKRAGNQITAVAGARTKELLILENELAQASDEFHIATDDGSYGRRGFTTDILKNLLSDNPKPIAYNLIYAVGPIPMMKKVAWISRDYGVKTVVSLNALMVDATGMCGCCRVTVSGKTKFSCVDGPEFDAHQIDWEELQKRNDIYLDKEKHICKQGEIK